jgi:hypothetical protein
VERKAETAATGVAQLVTLDFLIPGVATKVAAAVGNKVMAVKAVGLLLPWAVRARLALVVWVVIGLHLQITLAAAVAAVIMAVAAVAAAPHTQMVVAAEVVVHPTQWARPTHRVSKAALDRSS